MPNYKLTVTLFVVALALALAIIFKEQKTRKYILIAMIFGMAGDYFNTLNEGSWKVVVGGALFAVEHIIFIIMFIKLFKDYKLKMFNKYFIIGIIIFGLTIIPLEILEFTIVKEPNVLLACLVPLYVLIICVNLGMNLSYSFQRKGTFYLFALGILTFYLSDIFVFMDILNINKEVSKYVWLFYPIGQLLMVLFCDKLEKNPSIDSETN